MKTLSITGWTSFPEDCEFVESYTRDDGKVVDHRFTTYVETVEGEGVAPGRRIRINFWGRLATQAKAALVDAERVALLKIKDARISDYRDPYQGRERFSVNVNLSSEFEILDSRTCPAGNGFDALLGKLEHQHDRVQENDLMNSNPF